MRRWNASDTRVARPKSVSQHQGFTKALSVMKEISSSSTTRPQERRRRSQQNLTARMKTYRLPFLRTRAIAAIPCRSATRNGVATTNPEPKDFQHE
jgi:hypothetical protein